MTSRVYNFGAGPAMLPTSVLEKFQKELFDFEGMGVSVMEISHRTPQFEAMQEQAVALFRKLAQLPDDFEVLFMHGGAQMQFSAIPLNLMGRTPSSKALFVETGVFSQHAIKEAKKYGEVEIVASSADSGFDHIPTLLADAFDPEAGYVHITSNNTIVGTCWPEYPDTGEVPLVVDATSDILSKPMDFSKMGVMFASLQKNLGPPGMAMVAIRKDLLSYARPDTPKLLDYALTAKNKSLTNTTNTFAVYMVKLVLEWLEEQGGVSAIAEANQKKANCLYEVIDASSFYHSKVRIEHRSVLNVPFQFPNDDLKALFLKEALENQLYALKGHRVVGGARASIYNAMPLEGVEALASFMREFERTHG